jgi:hypothetical protein
MAMGNSTAPRAVAGKKRWRSRSVVVTGLQEINPVIAHQVNKSVFLGDSPRPCAGCKVLQWFWFANASKRITLDGFDQLKDFERGVPFGFDPESQILEKFVLKNRFSLRWFIGH